MLFHIEKTGGLTQLTPQLHGVVTLAVFHYGSAGVAVFFVLSGFVIAHSLTGKAMNGAAIGKFIVRRSVRLDPPYWVSMVAMGFVIMALALVHGDPVPKPEAGNILAHIFYVQELLRLPEIKIVYWTLTYEIQFYIVYAVSLWITALLARRLPQKASESFVFALLFGIALVAAVVARDWAFHGLFVNLWHGFFLGVLAYRAGIQRRSPLPLFILIAATIYGAFGVQTVFGVPCAATALLLFICARNRRIYTALAGPVWQWGGSISYSLYLIHGPVIVMLTGAWQRVAGRGLVADSGGFVFVLAACLIAASAFWWLIERPSQKWASRLFARAR